MQFSLQLGRSEITRSSCTLRLRRGGRNRRKDMAFPCIAGRAQVRVDLGQSGVYVQ